MRDYYRSIEPAAYLGAALIMVDQLSPLVPHLSAPLPGEGVWRFQIATMMVGRQVPLLLAGVVVGAIAWLGERPGLFRVTGWGLRVVAVLLALAAVVLWFDGPAARATVPVAQLRAFVGQWIRVLSLAAVGSVCFWWVGSRLSRTLK